MSTNEAPAGYDISVGRQSSDGWAKKFEGQTINGRLLGRYSFESGKDERAYYQIKLYSGCKAITGKGTDTKEVDLIENQIVNVDESKAMEDLKTYATNGGIYDVWLQYGKQDVDSKFWPVIGPKLKQIKAPPKADIPF